MLSGKRSSSLEPRLNATSFGYRGISRAAHRLKKTGTFRFRYKTLPSASAFLFNTSVNFDGVCLMGPLSRKLNRQLLIGAPLAFAGAYNTTRLIMTLNHGRSEAKHLELPNMLPILSSPQITRNNLNKPGCRVEAAAQVPHVRSASKVHRRF